MRAADAVQTKKVHKAFVVEISRGPWILFTLVICGCHATAVFVNQIQLQPAVNVKYFKMIGSAPGPRLLK